MRPLAMFLLAAAFALPEGAAAQSTDGASTQTILFIRHGEKPAAGLGQLDCQGLNRALKLPPIISAFGKVDAIFAPDPSQTTDDDGTSYNYVRPLATIEPTAIALGLPVEASIGLTDITQLRMALEQSKFAGALVVVAWEHHEIEDLTRIFLGAYGGDPSKVPQWKRDDFDSIYVITLVRSGGKTTASFERKHQGLDGQPKTCPR